MVGVRIFTDQKDAETLEPSGQILPFLQGII